jgi:hypothetical protein
VWTPRFLRSQRELLRSVTPIQREDLTLSLGKSFFVALFVAAVALLAPSWVPASAQTVPPVPPPIQPAPLPMIQVQPPPQPMPCPQDIPGISLLSRPTSKPPDVKRSQKLSGGSASPLSQESASAGVTAKAQEAYDAYTIAALRQRTAAFAWQAFASTIIFWLVVVLVLSGIAFSGIQFWVGLRRGTPADSTEVDVSLDGLKVRSQFLGVVTLALSLAFFYLYLKTVYPIVEAADTTATVHGNR